MITVDFLSHLRSLPQRKRLRAHVEASAAAGIRPRNGDRYLSPGVNPLRILLVGSGLAVGYGVATRRQAIDGQMGQRIAAATGRGVIVNNLARHGTRIQDQILSASTADSFGLEHVVVWTPSYLEMAERWWPTTWRSRLVELLAFTTPQQHVVVLELPDATGTSPIAAVASDITRHVNAELRDAARSFSNVVTMQTPPMTVRTPGTAAFDATYYSRIGEGLSDKVVALLAKEGATSST